MSFFEKTRERGLKEAKNSPGWAGISLGSFVGGGGYGVLALAGFMPKSQTSVVTAGISIAVAGLALIALAVVLQHWKKSLSSQATANQSNSDPGNAKAKDTKDFRTFVGMAVTSAIFFGGASLLNSNFEWRLAASVSTMIAAVLAMAVIGLSKLSYCSDNSAVTTQKPAASTQ